MVSSAKKPAKTAEEVALETQQRTFLDKEISEEERRLKAAARGTLGFKSLLSGASTSRAGAAAGILSGGGGGGGGASLLGSPTQGAASPARATRARVPGGTRSRL